MKNGIKIRIFEVIVSKVKLTEKSVKYGNNISFSDNE